MWYFMFYWYIWFDSAHPWLLDYLQNIWNELLQLLVFSWTVKTYESMTLEELEENEDEFGEDDEAAIEMYRWVEIMQVGVWCAEQPRVVCFILLLSVKVFTTKLSFSYDGLMSE